MSWVCCTMVLGDTQSRCPICNKQATSSSIGTCCISCIQKEQCIKELEEFSQARVDDIEILHQKYAALVEAAELVSNNNGFIGIKELRAALAAFKD